MLENVYVAMVVLSVAAYLVGSTPFAVLIARSKGVDLRKVGSGNLGATNVGRALGRRWGIACFLLDVFKGLLPVLATGFILGAIGRGQAPSALVQLAWVLTGCAAVVGHVLSFWLRFRGGKGVATSLGVVLGIFPYFTWPGLVAFGLWAIVVLFSRYISLGSILAALAFVPLFLLFHWGEVGELWVLTAFAAVMCSLLVLRHRSNISRLLAGNENRIGSVRRG